MIVSLVDPGAAAFGVHPKSSRPEIHQDHNAMMLLNPNPAAGQNSNVVESCLAALRLEAKKLGGPGAQVLRVPGTMAEKSPAQLYGALREDGEWVDGVLAQTLRCAANSTDPVWVVLDCGPLDPALASARFEPLHSLLDDNKTLALASGERIPLPPQARVVLLCQDSTCLSPATVSRLGMVYVEP